MVRNTIRLQDGFDHINRMIEMQYTMSDGRETVFVTYFNERHDIIKEDVYVKVHVEVRRDG